PLTELLPMFAQGCAQLRSISRSASHERSHGERGIEREVEILDVFQPDPSGGPGQGRCSQCRFKLATQEVQHDLASPVPVFEGAHAVRGYLRLELGLVESRVADV